MTTTVLPWYADEASFAAELARGRQTQYRVAMPLLPLGKWLRVGAFWFRDEIGKDPRAADEPDIEVEGGHLLEIKGRSFAFHDPTDYPYPTAFVGASRRWDARHRLPCTVVVYSEVTGCFVLAATCQRDAWVTERRRDGRRNFLEESLAVPRELLLPGERLFVHLENPCPYRMEAT